MKRELLTTFGSVVRKSNKKLVSLLGHDSVEVIKSPSTILVNVVSLDHLQEFVIADFLTELGGDSLQVVEGDLTGSVIVEELEDLLDLGSWGLVSESGSQQVQPLLELELAGAVGINFLDHLEDSLVLLVDTEGDHGINELLDGDGTRLVSVEKIKGILALWTS